MLISLVKEQVGEIIEDGVALSEVDALSTDAEEKAVTMLEKIKGDLSESELAEAEARIEELKDYGSYLNYYVGNEVVLVPIYGDVNDQVAMDIIAELYPTRKVVGINCLTLALFGDMVHCVIQQQPALDTIVSADQ